MGVCFLHVSDQKNPFESPFTNIFLGDEKFSDVFSSLYFFFASRCVIDFHPVGSLLPALYNPYSVGSVFVFFIRENCVENGQELTRSCHKIDLSEFLNTYRYYNAHIIKVLFKTEMVISNEKSQLDKKK